ncbi:MAG: diguanylate cyclase [Lachnospirales bacterium]
MRNVLGRKIAYIVFGVLIGLCLAFVISILQNKYEEIQEDIQKSKELISRIELSKEEENAILEYSKIGIKYGVIPENKVYSIIAEEVLNAFNLEGTAVEYSDSLTMVSDLVDETLTFSTNVPITSENFEKLDFSNPIIRYNLHFFFKKDKYNFDVYDYIFETKDNIVIGYPQNASYGEYVQNEYSANDNVTLYAVTEDEDVPLLIENDTITFFISDISNYLQLGEIDTIGIQKIEENTPYIHIAVKDNSNGYFISAVSKLLLDKEFNESLVNKINTYETSVVDEVVSLRSKDLEFELNKTVKIQAREFKPYVYQGEDGEVIGVQVDILKKIFENSNIDFEIDFVTIEDSQNIIDSNSQGEEYDLFIPAINYESIDDNFINSSSFLQSKQVVIGLDNSEKVEVESLLDLYSYKIAVIDNVFYDWYTKENLYSNQDLYKYKTLEQVIRAVEKGNIDFAIVPLSLFNEYAFTNTLLDVVVIEEIELPTLDFLFTFKRDEFSVSFINEFNMALENMDNQSIIDKYLSSDFSVRDLYKSQTELISGLAIMITIVLFVVIVTLTITTLRSSQKANVDEMTNLSNSRKLKKKVEKYKFNKDMAIALINIDDMKVINDIYGHSAGDEVIRYLADFLHKFPKNVKVFRNTGDRFIVIYNYKLFDFRDEIKKVLNTYVEVEDFDVMLSMSVSVLNLSKYGHLSFKEIIDILDYTMMIVKNTDKGKVITVEEKLMDSYSQMYELRKLISDAVDEKELLCHMEPVTENGKIVGGTLKPIFKVDGEVVDFDNLKNKVVDPKLLADLSIIIFDELCSIIDKVSLKGKNLREMVFIHEASDRIITKSDVENWKTILAHYKIRSNSVFFKVNPDSFKGHEGVDIAKTFHENGFEIVFRYSKIRGEILVILSGMEKFLVEIDTSILDDLLHLLKGKTKEDIENIFNNNLFFESQINFINNSNCDVIIVHNGDYHDELLIEYYRNKIKDKKIYYVLKGHLQEVETYI